MWHSPLLPAWAQLPFGCRWEWGPRDFLGMGLLFRPRGSSGWTGLGLNSRSADVNGQRGWPCAAQESLLGAGSPGQRWTEAEGPMSSKHALLCMERGRSRSGLCAHSRALLSIPTTSWMGTGVAVGKWARSHLPLSAPSVLRSRSRLPSHKALSAVTAALDGPYSILLQFIETGPLAEPRAALNAPPPEGGPALVSLHSWEGSWAVRGMGLGQRQVGMGCGG